MMDFFKNIFLKPKNDDEESLSETGGLGIKFKVVVVEFAENVESSAGEVLTALLRTQDYLDVQYFNEPFAKSFLNLEGRTFFDFIDKGLAILDKTNADVVVWGYREDNKIRLNFQTSSQYEKNNTSLVSLLDSLYLPVSLFDNVATFPNSVLNLILGAIISSLNAVNKQVLIQQKYILRKIIKTLSADDSAKNMTLEFLPYIMNFLAIIYLTFCRRSDNEKEFRIVNNLLDTAIKHQDLIKNPLHLGCIYNHFGQLHSYAIESLNKNHTKHYKSAISSYQRAQKYLGKYIYPYDYGFIAFGLSNLLYDYWRQKEDLQALRDSVFNLREAEKIFSYALFPELWADIEGELGHRLNILSSLTKNNAIAEMAIVSYKNQQKIITEKRDPFLWAGIQENIGNVYYRLGKETEDKDLVEESLEYFHDALYIFENMELDDNARRLTASIAKSSNLLS
ncbi:MAG: hypothetical protein E7020_03895 [Alphaproteobacteria bacterium]|nr:hypothetical protein [Alphaproteobacteria bacterium]